MKNGEREERVLGFWKELVAIQQSEAALQKRKEEVKDKLGKLIPNGQAVAGVKHTVVSSQRTAWREVALDTKLTLVPRTKWEAFENITKLNTKESVYSLFHPETEKREDR